MKIAWWWLLFKAWRATLTGTKQYLNPSINGRIRAQDLIHPKLVSTGKLLYNPLRPLAAQGYPTIWECVDNSEWSACRARSSEADDSEFAFFGFIAF